MGFMRRQGRFLLVFFVLLFGSLVILIISLGGGLITGFPILEKAASPIGVRTYSVFHKLLFSLQSKETRRIRNKKLDVVSMQLEIERLKKENAALKDQFQTVNPKSFDLLPAKIVGSPGFIPGITTPVDLIVDKGERDGVRKGDTVVFKNNLVGKIAKISSYLAKVELIFNSSSSFTVKTMAKSVAGIVKGNGNEIILNNVLPSEEIEVGDIVITKGDMNLAGIGYPPDLVVGEILSIDKNPSNLFQKAKLESFLDFKKLDMVFILKR